MLALLIQSSSQRCQMDGLGNAEIKRVVVGGHSHATPRPAFPTFPLAPFCGVQSEPPTFMSTPSLVATHEDLHTAVSTASVHSHSHCLRHGLTHSERTPLNTTTLRPSTSRIEYSINSPTTSARRASHLPLRRWRRQTAARCPPNPPRSLLTRHTQLPGTRPPPTPRFRLPLHQLRPQRQPAARSGGLSKCRRRWWWGAPWWRRLR